MRHHFSQSTLAVCFTIGLFSVSQDYLQAAPGTLDRIPLFVSDPIPPNIFFMLDDSGSMNWTLSYDGIPDPGAWTDVNWYYTLDPNNTEYSTTARIWQTWCRGANLMAYDTDTSVKYKPWSANKPGTNTPYPDQTDLTKVWVDPLSPNPGNQQFPGHVVGWDTGTVDLSNVPVVKWIDSDGNKKYDDGECPTSFTDTARVTKAKDLPTIEEKINFANWFAYHRIKRHTTKAAVTSVISTSSARMGIATLHHHNNVGLEIKNMSDANNKEALLDQVVKMTANNGTPLRERLDWVGQYFDKSKATPAGLNIGSASSPILPEAEGGECQQNFVMLMTDGMWNGNDPSGTGHQDKTVDNNFVYPAHADNTQNTLADVAMKWYKTDLAISLTGKVRESGKTGNLDDNPEQHLVTFGVAFGATGTLNSDPTDRTDTSLTWPVPTFGSPETLDDLRHAAYNGRGEFLFADNPVELSTGIQNVITAIQDRQGSAASVAFSSTSLTAGTTLFFASFKTTDWSGELEAINIDPTNGELDSSSAWEATSSLDSSSFNISNRVIYTWGTDSSGDNDGVLFNWSTADPQPATSVQNDLLQNQDGTTEATPFTVSQERLNFLRGDRSLEGTGLYRTRGSRLGDIVNSAPQFVGSPISNWPDTSTFGVNGDRYSNYQLEQQGTLRTGMVYVGANDGLLHGFNATTGEEVFAYLPSASTSTNTDSGLHYLTELDYNHQYYVDGSPVSADVYMPLTSSGASDWRTILVGTLRGGGQGVYALNVTDPGGYQNTEAAAKTTVLWEFTDQDDTDLGYTFSDPQVVMMNNGKWAVILGNGYNASGTDNAKLMILFIEEGVDGQWTVGDYIKIDTGVGSVGNKNGLSTPALIDLDNNGTTDRIYAGDLHGNMWAFDVSGSTTGSWVVANSAPLFIAGNTKPITMKPLLVKPEEDWIEDEDPGNVPNIMVYFGTGQYVANGDATTTGQQTFYGIWDSGSSVNSGNLVQQTITELTNERILTEYPVNYENPPSSGNFGWFINLPETGERVVVNAFEIAGLVFFNTLTPSEEPCESGGSSWLMAADMKTGGNPDLAAFDLNDNGLDNTDTSDGGFADDDKVTDSSGNLHFASGVRFDNGIASATSVISTDDGTSYGYISGTGTGTGEDKQGRVTKMTLPKLPGGTGIRRSWIQLIK